MHSLRRPNWMAFMAVVLLALSSSGCTGPLEYVRNRFKVGPEYSRPPAPVAEHWIEASDARLTHDSDDLSKWWAVFNDPALDSLIANAYGQNLTLRQAGMRVLQARAQLGIATGNLFPQTQNMVGDYTRHAAVFIGFPFSGANKIPSPFYFSQWDYGFNLAWELDFWGRFRRAVASAENSLDASVEGYDAALVTLLGDVATNYTQARVAQERIDLFTASAKLQREILKIVEARFEAGRVSELDVDQQRATVAQTEAQVPLQQIALRQATDALSVLLGRPPQNLQEEIGKGAIPTPPIQVAAGIPAQLLARRPDVRQAERTAAAQCQQIGIAEADFYPAISISGTLDYSAATFSQLFTPRAFNGTFGPSFRWNILNYGRIVNNVRYQDARFRELVLAYQQTVLAAAQEVEDGLATFLRAQERTKLLEQSVLNTQKAVNLVLVQYRVGTVDFTRVAQVENDLVTQQDLLAQSRGQIATGLIQVYRALGGGWQIRLESGEELAAGAAAPAPAPEAVPKPGAGELLEQPGAAPVPPPAPPVPPAKKP